MARQSLAKLFEKAESARRNIERQMRESMKCDRERLDEIVSRVYSTKDPDFIERFSSFIGAMESNVEGGVLRRRLNGLASYLQHGKAYRENKKAESEGRGELRVGKEAAEYLAKIDARKREEPLSVSGYLQRIYAAAERRDIKLRVMSERSKFIKKGDLDYIAGLIKKPTKKSGGSGTPYERYCEMRGKGLSREDVMGSGKIRTPKGKNRGKYFAALESCYQRHG